MATYSDYQQRQLDIVSGKALDRILRKSLEENPVTRDIDTKELPPLAVPTVHLNGTSRDELLKQLCDATTALYAAMTALGKAAPHGRDYYVQSADAIFAAQNQHYDRLKRLEDVCKELQRIGEAVIDQ